MPTVTTEVDFDLETIDDYDLIDELERRGYEIIENGREDDDLIDILTDRGYSVIVRDYLEELYSTYLTMSPEFFQKELKKLFREKLDVNIY